MNDDAQLRLAIFGFVVAVVLSAAAIGAIAIVRSALRGRTLKQRDRILAWTCVALGLGGVACMLYGRFVEPDWLEVVRLERQTEKLPRGERFRIVQLSDLHVEEDTGALRALPKVVNGLEADVVVFTGDAINARGGLERFREILSSLHARAGRYAVLGNHDAWYWSELDLFGAEAAHELRGDSPVLLANGAVALCGAPFGVTGKIDDCFSAMPEGAFRIFAYHSPDLVEQVAGRVDLYLAGHTHGGQVRLPVYGALITMSAFDKKYEMGRYEVEGTTLYVNRGIGAEPEPMPRIRFLARPEVTVIDLVGIGAR